jgi:ABC-type Fe3+ transport system substrate-binding protein
MAEDIKNILKNHEKRISALEGILKEKPQKPKVEYTGIPVRILELRDEGFFKNPKKVEEVRQALKDKGFYYEWAQIGMALLRLVRAKELRRIQEKRKFFYVNL